LIRTIIAYAKFTGGIEANQMTGPGIPVFGLRPPRPALYRVAQKVSHYDMIKKSY